MTEASPGMPVLIVEDSPLSRKLLEHALSGEPYSLLFAENGNEALRIIKEHKPAMVITDWMLPDCSGPELCERIRTSSCDSYTYIILLTSMIEKKDIYSLWVVHADLDNFKVINDTYGHEAGDEVLRGFAEILKENTRASDISGRTGGDEFLAILTHVPEDQIQLIVERLRARIASKKFTFGSESILTTASFGACGFQGKRPPEFSSLLQEADIALYGAKRAGRNQIKIGLFSVSVP
jgi:diguanylate cyclase (GGDEF)-like protein